MALGLRISTIDKDQERKNMKKIVLLLIALSCASSLGLALGETQGVMKSSDATAINSNQASSEGSGANFTLLNISQLAEQNPIDPKIGYLRTYAASGENASVNLTQIAPGIHTEAHYHSNVDEVDYVIQGQANMTVDGKYYLVQKGDLIYIPSFTIHEFTALGNETLRILVVFAPPFNNKDRIYV
jgi:quercetin dioxygenase-like cupin family protein